MTEINVSSRLKTIAGLITKNKTVADIGTDHGYLPIYMAGEGMAGKIIACDLREKPLGRGRKNAEELLIADRIDFRLADGLDALSPGEADTVIICGMGGFAIIKILSKALEEGKVFSGTDFVLSPHTDRENLSRFLFEKGFKIEEEILLHEKAAYYILWKCTFDGIKRSAPDAVHAYGSLLVQRKDAALKDYFMREEELLLRVLKKLEALPSDKVIKRICEVKERLKLNRDTRWF